MAVQVIQVYLEWTNQSLPSPQRQLIGFERVFIPVGQGVTSHYDVTLEQISVWDDRSSSFVTLKGKWFHCGLCSLILYFESFGDGFVAGPQIWNSLSGEVTSSEFSTVS